LLAAGLSLRAQSILPAQPPITGENLNGLRFNEISLSTIYADINYPQQTNIAPLSTNVLVGVAASFNWVVSREKTNFSLFYSPSYLSNLSYSSESGANHSLTLSLSRKLGAKWTWSASAAGSINTFSQFLFDPSQLSQIVSTQASFDQLAASVLTGTSSNIQLNNLVNAAPALDSPAAVALFGNRFLSASATTGLSYAPTSRLTIGWNAGASRVQPLHSGNDNNNSAIQSAATLGQAGMTVSYSLSPRTEISLSANASRSLSAASPRIYTGTGSGTLSRTMSRRWFLHAGVGGGYMRNVLQTGAGLEGPQYTYTGGVGFKTYAHTLMINYSRSLNNSGLALAGGIFNVATAAWTFNRPGSNWSMLISSSYQQQTYAGLSSFRSWNALGGVNWAVARQMSIQLAYTVGELGWPAYATNVQNYQGLYNAVRVSLIWSPQARLIR
jgi:hypothetical protein